MRVDTSGIIRTSSKTRVVRHAEKFLKKAKDKFNNRYDYSSTIYKGIHTKIEIICKLHGSYWQTPISHLASHVGCPDCVSIRYKEAKRKSIDQFLLECKNLHGDKYDYSNVAYINQNTQVKITCHIHGEFMQTPNCHLITTGCPQCGRKKRDQGLRHTKERIIEDIKKIYGDQYIYDGIIYANNNMPIEIVCKQHGKFSKYPSALKNGYGCPGCSPVNKWTTKSIVQRFIEIHGNKYNYSKVIYNGTWSHVEIICSVKEHGSFNQIVDKHLAGKGCAACAGNKKHTNNSIIKAFIDTHGDKYDYSKVKYIGANIKVEIICKKNNHGSFFQGPMPHKSGVGCPRCSTSVSNKEIAWLDSLNVPNEFRHDKNKKIYLSKPNLLNNNFIKPDALDLANKIVYEFDGDFHHGNPLLYKAEDINPLNKKTYGELYNRLLNKNKILKDMGYTVIRIWEKDYDESLRMEKLEKQNKENDNA